MEPLAIDFVKARYDAELARCNRLTDSLGLPIGALTVFGSLISVMGTGFSYHGNVVRVVFAILLAADCCAFAVCLMFLGIAYYRQDVAYLQTLSEAKDAWEIVQRQNPADSAKAVYEDWLRESTIEATDLNIASNDRRAGYLYRARVALLFVVALTGIAAVPYVVDQLREAKKIPIVHIDNLDTRGTVGGK